MLRTTSRRTISTSTPSTSRTLTSPRRPSLCSSLPRPPSSLLSSAPQENSTGSRLTRLERVLLILDFLLVAFPSHRLSEVMESLRQSRMNLYKLEESPTLQRFIIQMVPFCSILSLIAAAVLILDLAVPQRSDRDGALRCHCLARREERPRLGVAIWLSIQKEHWPEA